MAGSAVKRCPDAHGHPLEFRQHLFGMSPSPPLPPRTLLTRVMQTGVQVGLAPTEAKHLILN